MDKKAHNIKMKEYYKANPLAYKKHLEVCKAWYYKNRDKDITDSYIWRMKNTEKARETVRKNYKNNPLKIKERKILARINKVKQYEARMLVQNIPLKSSCEICGSQEMLEHHHWNYDKPLLFNTLCGTCHSIQRIKNFARWHQARLIADSHLMEVMHQN